jgi:N-glycosylase/DNA lyase
MIPPISSQTRWAVLDYDLAATLSCGQAFRWEPCERGWEGVVGARWVRLTQVPGGIAAETIDPGPARPADGWPWLAEYLQTSVDLDQVLSAFPEDEPLRAAVGRCRGLRLLRQEPWECLASFILSSNKQIVQIRQIIARLCERFGDPIPAPQGHRPVFAFPSAARLAQCAEAELRECRMGFRAPHLLEASRKVAGGELALHTLSTLPLEEARRRLLGLRGVGHKIADCVLLFALGFSAAFPIDVWVMRTLRQTYFPRRRPSAKKLREFVATRFGPQAGYAQQYIFHSARLAGRTAPSNDGGDPP